MEKDKKVGGKRMLVQDKTETGEPPSKMRAPSFTEDQKDDKAKWQYLEHHGMLFPDLYSPFSFRVKIKVAVE